FQCIAALLSIPCFESSKPGFEFFHLLNCLGVACLGCKDLFPQISHGCISHVGIVHVLNRLCNIEHRLERAQTGENLSNHRFVSESSSANEILSQELAKVNKSPASGPGHLATITALA